MNVGIIGSGGREHAICYMLNKSKKVSKIFCFPGNAGTSLIATNVSLDPDNFSELEKYCLEKNITMLVVGPEKPLVNGIVNHFKGKSIRIFGPDKISSKLEGSKIFTKKICKEFQIPTAKFGIFKNVNDAKEYLSKLAINKSAANLSGVSTEGNYVLDIDGSVLVSVGNSIGIGTTGATQALHVAESVRIGKQIFDSRNQDGALNAFLSKDANGITWVTQTPSFTEGIFLMDESVFVPTPEAGGQVGAGQSFQTINFVNRNSLGISIWLCNLF